MLRGHAESPGALRARFAWGYHALMPLVQPEIYAAVVRLLAGRERGALCTVVKTEGSVPGKLGAKMLVFPDGSQLGTVGGAGFEEQVRAWALEAIRTRQGGTRRFVLSKWAPGGLNSLCGGIVEVYVEVLTPPPHLLICGGGHVGQALAQQCDLLGWRYAVLDDRPEYRSAALFPSATARIAVTADDPLPEGVDLAPYSDIFVLGYSWEVDAALLARLLTRTEAYLGLIGSRTKAAALRKELEERGTPPEAIARMVCPIGLMIGAESPAEIALAVAAEVLQRHKGAG